MLINVDAVTPQKRYYERNKKKHQQRTADWKKAHPEYGPDYHLRQKASKPERYLLRMAKTRAKKKGLEFSIGEEDIHIPMLCPYFLKPLDVTSAGYNPWFPSIDRIDSSKGYIKGNVQVISTLANRMKWDATEDQLISFAEGVLRKVGRAFAN
jgi:hypothetical protein